METTQRSAPSSSRTKIHQCAGWHQYPYSALYQLSRASINQLFSFQKEALGKTKAKGLATTIDTLQGTDMIPAMKEMVLLVMVMGCGEKQTPPASQAGPSTPQAAGTPEPELPPIAGIEKSELPSKSVGPPAANDPSLAGTFQVTLPNGTFTLKLFEDGKAMVEKVSNSGVKDPESSGTGTWSVKNGEVMVESEAEGVDETMIFKINPGGTLTPIANITDGKREDVPERIQKFMVLSKPLTIPKASPTEEESVTPGDKGKKHKQITIGNETAAWISDPNNPQNVLVEEGIREQLRKLTGELTKADIGKVKELAFYFSGITDAGLKEVAKLQQLTALVLVDDATSAKITIAGVKEVVKLQKLTSLNWGVKGITDAGVKEVAKLKQLTELGLGGAKITEAGLKEVAKMKQLTSLNLSATKITDAGLKEVAKLQKLTRLRLMMNSQITDVGLKEVTKMKQLTKLDLRFCRQITDEGLKELAKLKNLSEVNLKGNKVTKAGVGALNKALPDCNILHDAKK